MKWQCALLQRWLPEYPDGDLSGWRKGWLQSHLAHCSSCRQELSGFKEVVTAIQAAPAQDPGPEFWKDFSRDMHLKLVQTAQENLPEPSSTRWFRLPYLLGAPVLAVLLLWVAVNFTGFGTAVENKALVMQGKGKPGAASKMAEAKKPSQAPPAALVAAPNGELEQLMPVALGVTTELPAEEVDISDWDLDSELAGMTDQERERFIKKLDQRSKDGSCLEKYSLCFWA